MNEAQMSAAAYNRRQAMQVWRPVQVSYHAPRHPRYPSRYRSDGRSLARHALAALVILGALVLIANV
jgi:hypothetical protein